MKKVKMLANREVGGDILSGDSIYTLADDLADDLIADGRAELIAVVPDPAPEAVKATGEEKKTPAPDKDPDQKKVTPVKARTPDDLADEKKEQQ